MVLKVGINGFGRVGRVVFRTCLEHPDVEVCAINDPAIEVDYICYLIKYDSTHGKLKSEITHTDGMIKVNDLCVKVFQDKYPAGIPWHTANAEYIVEASGMFTNLEKASGHLHCNGIKRVIVTAPCVDVPMVILGVNEKTIGRDVKVISCGSSTLYCLAPIVKVLEDNYGVDEGFITSIHAMTPSLKPLDGLCLKGKHWRDHRSITQNIIPAATGACKALGRIIPSVRDRMCGLAFRVPIANVSVLDLTVRLKKDTSIENIAQDIEKFNKTTKNILRTNSDEAVSSDFIGDSYSCILDLGSSIQLRPDSFKLICWYENEYSYACRVVDLILFSENQFKRSKSPLRNIFPSTPTIQSDVTQQSEVVTEEKTVETDSKVNVGLDSSSSTKRLARLKQSVTHTNQSSGDPAGKFMLCRIWDDDVAPIRHKPTAFFQACPFCSIPPPNQPGCRLAQEPLEKSKQNSICTKAQERLDKMKQEFSKMVTITETLLKKSYNSILHLDDSESNKDLATLALDNKADVKKTETVNHTLIDLSNMEIGDNISYSSLKSKICVGNFHNQSEENNVQEDKSGYSISTISDSVKKAKDTEEDTTQQISKVNDSFITNPPTNIFVREPDLEIAHSTCKNIIKVHENKEQPMSNNESNNSAKSIEQNIKPHSHPFKLTVTDGEQLTVIKVLNLENYINKTTDEGIDKNYENSENLSPNNVDVEADQKHNDEEQIFEDIQVDQQCGDWVRTAERVGSRHSDAQIEGSSSVDVSNPDCEADAASEAPETHYRDKQDIFDKLDSGSSASGSNTSFEIRNKQSEVIKITDLTNSLEDLDRLDKICKIMEISDELSDKLFSVLNKSSESSSVNVARKRWSFKDLCEKVNLDEFCNKVFGN